MIAKGPFEWTLSLLDLPREGLKLERELSAEERAALARFAGIEAVRALSISGEIRPWADGFELALDIAAEVTQACVVTLAPVDNALAIKALRRYLPAGHETREEAGEVELDMDSEEAPETLSGDMLDIAGVVTEELILALDPYPRAPGAALVQEARESGEKPSPFAALAGLKHKN